MPLRKRRSYSYVWNAFLVGLLAFSFCGCNTSHSTANFKGFALSSNVPLKSYVHFAVGANGHKESRFYFPLLQIYDKGGRLVYVSHDTEANAKVLEKFPNNTDSLQPIPQTTLLQDVIKELPEFETKRDDLLRTKRTTVLSVFLEDCHACSVQEEALDNTQNQLLAPGVNLLIVRVAKSP
jgi:hypothetical protein